MKKVLLIGAAALGIYFLTSGKKNTGGSSSSSSSSQPTFFQQYEGKIVVDPAGYWMVIKSGKIYTFTNEKTLNKYQADFPQHAQIINVDFPAWMQYATQQTGGVTSLPGY